MYRQIHLYVQDRESRSEPIRANSLTQDTNDLKGIYGLSTDELYIHDFWLENNRKELAFNSDDGDVSGSMMPTREKQQTGKVLVYVYQNKWPNNLASGMMSIFNLLNNLITFPSHIDLSSFLEASRDIQTVIFDN